MPRACRLTDRQVAVLAVLDRNGTPTTLPALRTDLPELSASVIARTLDALINRGLVASRGDRTWLYLGEIPEDQKAAWVAAGRRPVPPEDIVRFWSTSRSAAER